jgi:hypothetical protein
MTYGINIRPYDDPLIAIAEEAIEALSDLAIAGPLPVDIIPILKYIPAWFPGAEFQKKGAMLRTHAEKMRNGTFAAARNLMVFLHGHFSGLFSNSLAQENGAYDPSLVSEVLRQTWDVLLGDGLLS